MTNESRLVRCMECKMPVGFNEYHPYAACLMFKQCDDADVVRKNLAAVRATPTTQPEASTTNSDEISSKLVDHPAHTHCENCGCTWLDDGLNPVGCPYCKPEAERLAVCEWRHIENEGAWASGCGEYWMFTDGGPAENRYKFCHGCGKPVRVKGESDA